MKSLASFSPSPDSQKKNFDSDAIFPEDSQLNINLNNSLSFQKKQKFYIATKISGQSPLLRDNSFHVSSNLRKTIKEEDDEENEIIEKEKNLKENLNNIFQCKKSFNENLFNELNNGPRYGEKGKIVPYSILGRPDNFLKLHNLNKTRSIEQKKQMEDLKTPRNSNKIKSHNLGPNNNTSLSRKPSLKSVHSDKTKDLNIPYKSKYIRTNKEQLLKELEEYEQISNRNQEKEKLKLDQLRFHERIYLTQDQRKLEAFEKKRIQWIKDVEKICNTTDKSLNQTVMLQFDDYRRNKEKLEELEKLKEVIEKKPKENQNDFYWYFSLRDYPEDEFKKISFKNHEKCKKVLSPLRFKNIGKFTLLQDLPNGFKIGVINNESKKESEKIREPFLKRLKVMGPNNTNNNTLISERILKKNCEINKSFEGNSNFNILLENSFQENHWQDEFDDLEVYRKKKLENNCLIIKRFLEEVF
jgi:hypothetical protein